MRLSLYLHYPFCVRKCLYCDFNSVSEGGLTPAEYAGLVVREVELRRESLPERVSVPTVYFGGGTPSLMEPALVGRIMEAIDRCYGVDAGAEVTLEANPGTVTEARLRGYRGAGINRLSLGVQSFEDRLLALLGRVHTAQEALDAFAAARRAGFDNVSIDLMHSLPDQSPHDWHEALLRGAALAPEHISAYALSVEEHTPFEALVASGRLQLPDEDDAVAMFELTGETLEAHGYRHYEISNFAREGRASRHNGVYWERGSYLGLGAGAHSFLNDSSGCGCRFKNPDAIRSYQESVSRGAAAQEELQQLSLREAVSETFFLGLRRLSGVNLAETEALYGAEALRGFLPEVRRLLAGGMLVQEGDTVRLAPAAVIVANRVFSCFL